MMRRMFAGVVLLGVVAGCDTGTGVQIPAGEAELRIVNASADAQTLQVLVGTRNFTTGAFPAATAYGDAPTGVRQLQVRSTLNATPRLTATVGFQVDSRYTFVILNRLESLQGLLLTDDAGTPGAGTALLRLVNAAPGAGSIDLYLTAPGVDIQTATPSLAGLSFRQASTYLNAVPGTYRLRAAASGTKTVIMDVPSVTIAAGQIRTAIVVEAAGGGAPHSVLMLQDS